MMSAHGSDYNYVVKCFHHFIIMILFCS